MKTKAQIISDIRLEFAKMGSLSDYCDVCGLPPGCRSCSGECLVRGLLEKKG